MLLFVLLLLLITSVATGLWWSRKDPLQLGNLSGTDPILTAIADQVSTRLQVRFVEPGDLGFFLEMANDQDAAEANGWTGDEAPAIRRRFADHGAFSQFRLTELVAVEQTTNTRVATATLTRDSSADPGTSTVGIHVHPDHRRQGYGREIMAVALTLLQRQSPNELYVGTRVTNLGLQHIMTSLGYQPEPEVRAYTAPNGQIYDSLWYRCGKSAGAPQL